VSNLPTTLAGGPDRPFALLKGLKPLEQTDAQRLSGRGVTVGSDGRGPAPSAFNRAGLYCVRLNTSACDANLRLTNQRFSL
jgi:hypothetical protein